MISALEKDLKRGIRGEVRFGVVDRALYAADASNYREVPGGVVLPNSIEDMVEAVAICARHNASILHRGGGTSLAGQTVSEGSVVIDSSKYCNRILEIDAANRTAIVEPGTVLDDLRDAANVFGLTFGPDPSTHNHNTLGGMLGNNSCGTHSVVAHRTVDNVTMMDILTYDGIRMTVGKTGDDALHAFCKRNDRVGEIYRGLKYIRDTYADEIRARFPKIPRRVSGYSLDELLPENGFDVARALIGSEGTCVTILQAAVKLIEDPPMKSLLVIGFEDILAAADAVPDILPFKPRALEGLDQELTDNMRAKNFRVDDLKYLPKGGGWLMAQFAGKTVQEATALAQPLRKAFEGRPGVTEIKFIAEQKDWEVLWKIREAGLPVTAWVPGQPDAWEGWEDSAVAPEKLGAYMRDLKKLYAKYGYKGAMYGHFGDGLIHTRITSGLHTVAEVENFRSFLQEAATLVVRHGGTLSGEHGDGRSRAELLPIMYGPKLIQAFEEFRRLWDPHGRMNPGKLVFPKKITTDLRYGPQFKQPQLETVFAYPESENTFARAVMRCVGVGECRRHKGGTMCPSFRATREEKHSTRGRAHLLQEMLEGDPVKDGWKSKEVLDALSLCLSCKGCKTECPVNVDMATYRAEFMHHHYKGKLRPLASYSMGLVHRWAPFASHLAPVFNFLTQTPGLRDIAKWAGGVHPKRRLPKLAAKTFRAAWKSKPVHNGEASRPRALLWADTFNNYFTPEPLIAAAQLLQRCGYEVVLGPEGLCCGRPFYDFGRLHQAKDFLKRCIESLTPYLDARTWIVGIEPSCLSVFREEINNLFPGHQQAKWISEHTLTLGAFLKKHGHPEFKFDRNAVLHGHCHHKSVIGMQDDIDVLKSAGPLEVLDSGCCGMAGAFGYEKEKYEVSKTIAGQGIVPLLRKHDEAHVIADGFSCRHQIKDFAGRQALTTPEILLRSLAKQEAS